MSVAINRDVVYTYEDYAQWPEDKRYELIEGVPRMMSAPTLTHQDLALEIGVQFKAYLRYKQCRVYIAPCDVLLKEKSGRDTVVQPDLLVVCDPDKLTDGKKVNGAPDIVVEILSVYNMKHDTFTKLNIYQRHGVKEYITVSPDELVVMQYVLLDGIYTVRAFDGGAVPSAVLEGFSLDIETLKQAVPQEVTSGTSDTTGEEQ